MKESTLGWAECESVECLGDTQNPISKPSISGMEEEEGNETTETETFGFPILDISRNISMKNIPLSSLPTFRGMSTEDPDYSYSSLTYYVEAITTQTMPQNLSSFLLQ
jgi:hypothetical protein